MIYSKFSKRQLMAMLWWQQKRYKDRDAIIADGSIRSGKTVSMTDGFVLWSMTCFNHQAFAICGKTIESLRRNVVLPLRDWLSLWLCTECCERLLVQDVHGEVR